MVSSISDFGKAQNADLTGPHGHSPLESLMGGSVAERVVKHASCPVVAVKHK